MTAKYKPYPEIPNGNTSWSHVGTDAEEANIFAVTTPVVFYDKSDNRYTVFQKFPGQKPVMNSHMVDECSIGRVFIVTYEGRGTRIRPVRLIEYKLNAGQPIITSSTELSGRRALINWYIKHGRQKPRMAA